jgi:O-acetyl-ADP-ribose deacetylase (regulator of RNase III)
VHTVGPNRRAGQTDPALLASSFSRSLEVAAGLGAATVAMPAVGAGIYGWDAREVADIAVGAVRETAGAGRAPGVTLVRFVLFGRTAHAAFEEALAA